MLKMSVFLISFLCAGSAVGSSHLLCNVLETQYSADTVVKEIYDMTVPLLDGFADARSQSRLDPDLQIKVSAITKESKLDSEVVAITFISKKHDLLAAAYGEVRAHGTYSIGSVTVECQCILK